MRRFRHLNFNYVRGIAFHGPYYLDQILDDPEQWVAIGWVSGQLYSVIYEDREDNEGAYYHLVTLWKSTRAERVKYEDA